jgi:alkylhydroperoxidase/carboxymuconolactone decarboxylase family protein YurZ
MALTEQDSALRTQFNAELGPDEFHQGWASLLSLDPQFFKASVALASVPRQKSHLSRKDQVLIALAVDSTSTHPYSPGIRTHVSAALKEGASLHDVLEVIELSSTLGIHACNIGVPLLVEVLKEGAKYLNEITRPYDERQTELKKEFSQKRGYWHAFWEDFLTRSRVLRGLLGLLERAVGEGYRRERAKWAVWKRSVKSGNGHRNSVSSPCFSKANNFADHQHR